MALEDFMPAPDDGQLSAVRDMATELQRIRTEMVALTAQLKELAADERQISQHDLPEKMREIGLTDFTLGIGGKVSIRQKVKASLSAAKKSEGLTWLRDNGFGDLIKSREIQEGVHANTLSAFVKEQLSMGKPLPTTLFGVYEYDETTIK